ncbi:ImmA/IrrE family metallo-endopeptidase [uncultured Anaerococcus sp.]|uniref:ImmA/IrrE family metallo-endopeptidase n=1 Tax=uncultured Anaerococcus sp. TaxID=293428 RepID=UPI00288B7F0B|nr:ImmA/IrrE family metallo-endopeptidase [uncultured Anaerococcus sp.]
MAHSYDQIYEDVLDLIKKYGSRDPREILEERGVHLIAFKEDTKLLGMYKIIFESRFVFYNPHVDYRIRNMVFAHELGHDLYHQENAKKALVEYELFDIKSEMEIEANIFAAHLLLDEKRLMEDIIEGYTYNELASMHDVNVNLMIFKLNEMHRMGMPIRKEDPSHADFFKDINGKDLKNLRSY